MSFLGSLLRSFGLLALIGSAVIAIIFLILQGWPPNTRVTVALVMIPLSIGMVLLGSKLKAQAIVTD